MDVTVQGDALVVTLDRQWQGTGADLLRTLWIPQGLARTLFAESRVVAGSLPVHAGHVLQPGQRVRLLGGVLSDDDPSSNPPQGRSDILYEDEHLLVANKAAGWIVHSDGRPDVETLTDQVQWHVRMNGQWVRVWHVHRLDRETTGAVLFAKHVYAARALDTLMARGDIHREYVALVSGIMAPREGTMREGIGRDRHVAGRYRVSVGGKPAVTHYRTLISQPRAGSAVSLLRCRLETGRTHQIRVHLSARGCPVVGDTLYGGGHGVSEVRWDGPGHALHAFRIEFTHPYARGQVAVEAPWPEPWVSTMAELGWQIPDSE